MGLREMKMERTRQLIADTAISLFREHGFAATTIEQIAAAAEVGARTVYRYYPTKEALVVRFIEDTLDIALEDLRALPEHAPLPQALYQVIESVRRTVADDPERLIDVYRIANRTPSIQAQLSAGTWNWRQDLAEEILRRTSGDFAELVAALAAANIMNIIEISVQEWVRAEEHTAMDRAIERGLELLRTGAVPVPAPPVDEPTGSTPRD
ncbi:MULTISPECIES: helix-turn-helix domain-containing protein [unclassified Streptomyces]|uniref:TetR/AcrR family transcriptional regulator n=1 Tax=unclassified Streptomyces TaxID=2593676 RepID=UPI0033BE5562